MASTAQQFESNIDFQQYAAPVSTDYVSGFGGYVDRDGNLRTGGNWTDVVGDFFTGYDTKQNYQNYLTNLDRQFELGRLNDARAYETWFDSTKYQRAVADLKAAGLNPYLAIQSGISGSGSSSVGYSSSAKSSLASKNTNKGASVAALAIAAAKILALLV